MVDTQQSVEVIAAFKSKIDDFLALLYCLDEKSKDDLWEYWKTVCSTVKKAINGKGDIIEPTTKSCDCNQDISNVDRNAITVIIPIRHSFFGQQKHRILKVANHKHNIEYFEKLAADSKNKHEELEVKNMNHIDVINTFHRAISKEEILEPPDLNLKNTGCEDVKNTVYVDASDIEILPTVSEERKVKSVVKNSQVTQFPKPSKVIWPVTCPVTRSRGSRGQSHLVKNEKSCNDVNYDKEKNNLQAKLPNNQSKNCQQGFNIPCKPSVHSNSACTTDKTVLNPSVVEKNVPIAQDEPVSSILEPVVSENNSSSVEQHISNTSLPTSQTQKNDTENIDEESKMIQCVTGDVIYENHHDSQNSSQESLTQRNTSDLETIISALEEELKKRKTEELIPIKDEEVVYASQEEVVNTINTCPSTFQIINGDEVVEVQNLENVVWTEDGQIQVLEPSVIISGSDISVSGTDHHLDACVDVVEYEVVTNKKRRGRKKVKTHEDEAIDRTCPVCNRVLTFSSSMAAHMRTHTGSKPYSCGQCDRNFSTKANRDRHEATHVGLKPFVCPTCGKCFSEKQSMIVHQRTHTGERPFVCQLCGKGFTQNCSLRVHMDRHTNRKSHLCDLCGKAFRQKCQLDVHVKRHNRQANFPCDQCSVRCYSRGDLMRHMIKHTGERPFHCSQCPRTFTRKQYLNDHENVHSNHRPYKCDECSEAFHDMATYRRHKQKHRTGPDPDSQDIKPVNENDYQEEFSQEDVERILKETQIGEVMTLKDGSSAVLKAVVSEKDGSTAYHVTYINNPNLLVKEEEVDVKEEEVDTQADNIALLSANAASLMTTASLATDLSMDSLAMNASLITHNLQQPS